MTTDGLSLRSRLVFEANALRLAVEGDDVNGVLGEWFRVAYLREVAATIDEAIAKLDELSLSVPPSEGTEP